MNTPETPAESAFENEVAAAPVQLQVLGGAAVSCTGDSCTFDAQPGQ